MYSRRGIAAMGLVALLAIAALAQTPVTSPSGIAGNWKWSIDVGGSTIDMSATLSESAGKITGRFVDGFDNTSYDVLDGKLNGSDVSFKISRTFQDGTIESFYTGKLDADGIKGKIEIHMTGLDNTTTDWSAKRQAAAPATAPSN